MSESNRYTGAHLAVALIVGAVAGAAIALLTAPQSGRETREKVRAWGEAARDKAASLPHAAREAYDRGAKAAREAFHEAVKKESPGSTSG